MCFGVSDDMLCYALSKPPSCHSENDASARVSARIDHFSAAIGLLNSFQTAVGMTKQVCAWLWEQACSVHGTGTQCRDWVEGLGMGMFSAWHEVQI